jgi:2-oxoglutarate/2-oxoacid ferredoxin oxidoreductase subunit alpha
VLRSEYLVDVRSYTRVEGRPLFAAEIEQAILEVLES